MFLFIFKRFLTQELTILMKFLILVINMMLKVISVDIEKLQVGCSIKQLSPDPFEHIENYELNKVYKVKVVKLMDFGAFCELEPGFNYITSF